MLCKYCNRSFPSKNSFTNHVHATHKFQDSFLCGQINCHRSFNSIKDLKRHLYSCFIKNDKNTNVSKKFDKSELESTSLCNEDNVADSKQSAEICFSPSVLSLHQNTNDMLVLHFISKLYNNNAIPRSAIQNIIEDTSQLFTNLFDKVNSELLQKNVNISTLKNDYSYAEPFKNFDTEYKRHRSLEKLQFIIKPKSFHIGHILDNVNTTNGVQIKMKNCEGRIIPMRIVLQKFLELPNVLSNILTYIKNENGSNNISSIFNTNLWKSLTSKYDKNKIILPLYIYFDDFETGNPLGTHASVHKLGAMYFTLGGIPLKYSSKLENIFLWGLFHSSDRVTFGNNIVFRPFINELLHLETEGITINTDEGLKQIYFIAPFLLGDNLGINSLIGFQESFSSTYFCRICFSEKNETKKMIDEQEHTIQNPSNYNMHLNDMCYGIKEECVWNVLPSYHNTINVTCDVMHDLTEGICRYEMAEILYYFMNIKQYFDINTLNNRIKYFDYYNGVDIGNSIPPINMNHMKKKVIIMSSAEMHAFVTYFTLIVSDLIEPDDEVWEFYLLLYNIVHLIYKKEISLQEIKYLKYLVQKHHAMYMKLFNTTLKPKHHFLIHYARLIASVGPLSHLSSIRFEAFHKISKTIANVVTSRKNIVHTLAIKHQLKLSYRFVLQKGLNDVIVLGPTLRYKTYSHLNLENIPNYSAEVSWIKVNNILFKPKLVIQIDRDSYGDPIFGLIKHILYNGDDDIFIIYMLLQCHGINKHYEAYVIDKLTTQEYNIINIKQLYTLPTIIHKGGDGNQYISNMNQD
ncbi:uncharacterized protein [Temnothorax longispinosus]|uniref:uncharacterized protein n=1 Tax=Temnothorax longispinosus TaxID=300112 RepID=UPI003A99833B